MSLRYNNYHKHDHVSSIYWVDTNTHAEEYIKKCVEYGHTNYFTTNHGTMGDIFEAKTLCDKYGLRCLVGMEGYIVPNAYEKDKSNYHIILIPKTNKARRKLNIISSRANIEGYYYRPRIFLEDLLNLDKDDVYITTACIAGLLKDETSFNKIFLPLYNQFGENLFLEVQSHIDNKQIAINRLCLRLHQKLGLKLIAANDSHYVNEDGKQERLELLKGKGVTYGDEDNFILDFPNYETMFERFQKQGVLTDEQIKTAINNTLIFDYCEELDINKEIKMPNIYHNLNPEQRVRLLKQIVTDEFNKIVKNENIKGDKLKEYVEGIRYEMKIIEDTNDEVHTADYFLFNTKMVDIAVNKYNGVLTRTGRGSCASFYINRILGMTQIDRFQIDLPLYPDRFASTARLIENRALPDIDYNVKSQEPFVRASKDLLGKNGCYPMIAYGTMQIGEAFRNVCRSHGLIFDEYNEVAKNIENYMDNDKWKPLIEEAQRYVGTIISASPHPCAHILSDKDLIEEYGVIRIGDVLCVMITSSEADEYKVLKNDYLIVKVWKLISETFDLIGKPIIELRDLLENIKDDDRIWNLFKNGITCTLNQVDSDNGTRLAKQYGVSSFEEGAYLTAAIRPSFDSWREDFLQRKEYDTGSSELNKLLKKTHGYILFQENLMQYFEWLGVTPAESIGLIKKISKKKIRTDDFNKLESRLRENWFQQVGTMDGFDHTWELMQNCMSYGFACPHACATSGDMCYGAYLKVNYPLEYYTVALSNYEDDLARTKKLTEELAYFKITLKPISFGKSKGDYSLDKSTNSIYKGIGSIKYCNAQIADELYNLSKNSYYNFLDLLKDIKEKTSVNSRQLEILITLDFFKKFGGNQYLLQIVDLFNKFASKKQINKNKLQELELSECLIKKYSNMETKSLYKEIDNLGLINELISSLNKESKLNIIEQMDSELEYLGYIEYINPQINKYYYYVKKCKVSKYNTANLVIRNIKTGNEMPIRIKSSKLFKSNPLEKSNVIKVNKKRECFKKRPNAEGKWVAINETEFILEEYEVIK